MADFGAIGTGVQAYSAFNVAAGVAQIRNVALGYQGFRVFSGAAKSIAGTVVENGVPVRRLVAVYRRATREWLGETWSSASDGSFTLTVPDGGEVFALALDDTGIAPDFNAQIFDRITLG